MSELLTDFFIVLDDMGHASDPYYVELVEGQAYTVEVAGMTYTGVAKKATYEDPQYGEFVYVGNSGLAWPNNADFDPSTSGVDFCFTYVPEFLQTPNDESSAVSINEIFIAGMALEEVTVKVYSVETPDDPIEPKPEVNYSFGIELISGLKPATDFPLLTARDVLMPDGTRLDELESEPPSYELKGVATELEPEKYYVFGEVSSLNLTLVLPNDGRAHEHCFEFKPASDFTSLTISPEPTWASPPQFTPGKTCQVSVMRGIGVMVCA